jgi:Protein of unknown function (DUF3168)
MSAESDLYAVLSGHAPLTALVSTRIYPNAIPEDQALPAVVYSTEGDAPEWCLNDTPAATPYRFRIVAWGVTRTAAKAIGDAIVTALLLSGVPYDNRFSGFDAEVGQFADVTEITWWE